MKSNTPYSKLASALLCLIALLSTSLSEPAFGQKRGRAPQKPASRAAGIAGEADKLLEESKWPEAIDTYKIAIRLDPNYGPAYGGLGDAYFNTGKWEEGLAAFKEQVRLDPNSAQAQYDLGFAYNAMGRHGEAFAPLVKATSLDPSYAEAYYGIGYAYLRGADFEKSLPFFKSAIRLQAGYADAYYGLGQAYARLDQGDNAHEQVKKLSTIDAKLSQKLEKEIQTALATARPAEGDAAGEQVKKLSTTDSKRPQRLEQQIQTALPGANQARPSNATLADPATVEAEYWDTIKASNSKTNFEEYLKEYPQGRYAPLARVKLRQMEEASKPSGAVGDSVDPASAAANTSSIARPGVKQGAVVKNQIGMELVSVPPGSFMMGNSNGEADEQPAHQVTIGQAFYMGKYEVTQAQWQSVMGNNPSHFKDCPNCPVEQVSWDDTQKFISKLNESNDGFRYRLPTEAEWEYACRAGTAGDYAGSVGEMGWYLENSGNETHAVGGKRSNDWGLADMHGNVSEWCQDWYQETYEGAPRDGSAWLSGGEQSSRVLRGGSLLNDAARLRSAYRAYGTPDYSLNDLGFRVVAQARTN